MKNKVELVSDYIAANIRDGSWPKGTKLPSENETCRLLNVSRTSVRAAIQRYISTGILESKHGKGTYVCSTDLHLMGDKDNLRQNLHKREELILIHHARYVAEPEVFAYAAEHATPELIEKLEECNLQMINSIDNQHAFVEADMQFHKTAVDFMDNKYITAYFEPLLINNSSNSVYNDVFGYYDGIQHHAEILKAIKERNPKKARSLLIEHARMQIEVIQKIEEMAAFQKNTRSDIPDVAE